MWGFPPYGSSADVSRVLGHPSPPSPPDFDDDTRGREREIPEQVIEPLPCESCPLTSAVEPLVPRATHVIDHRGQAPPVAVDAEVVEVALDTSPERGVLFLNRQVPMISAPVV